MVRQGLKRIVEESADLKVIGETGDGLETITLTRKLKPDMIILDISMPNLRGIEAIHKIKKYHKDTKILILTMHKNEEFVYECLASGAEGYVLKEDAEKDLLAAINAVKNGKTYVSPSFTGDVIRDLLERKKDVKRVSPTMALTNREREILKLIAEGNSNKKVARKLGISVRTVEHHRLSIMRKLGVSNTASLIKYAIKAGFADLT